MAHRQDHNQASGDVDLVRNPPRLPDDDPIGEALVREIVAWAKRNAPPAIAQFMH
jgi:hypothetical protein